MACGYFPFLKDITKCSRYVKTDEWNFKKQTALQSERATLASGKETRAPTPLVTREQKELSAERTQKPFPTGGYCCNHQAADQGRDDESWAENKGRWAGQPGPCGTRTVSLWPSDSGTPHAPAHRSTASITEPCLSYGERQTTKNVQII